MSLFRKIFGGGGAGARESEPEKHEGFDIFPEPLREGSKWRIAARIEKEIGGELKSHQLIRADTLDSEEAAIEASLRKAKQAIDEQGDRLLS